MKHFIIAQSRKEFYTSHSGLALVGLCINRRRSLPAKARDAFPVSAGGIGLDDIIRSYAGLLTMGKSDFEAITDCRDDEHFSQSLGVAWVPSAETVRKRLYEVAPTLRGRPLRRWVSAFFSYRFVFFCPSDRAGDLVRRFAAPARLRWRLSARSRWTAGFSSKPAGRWR